MAPGSEDLDQFFGERSGRVPKDMEGPLRGGENEPRGAAGDRGSRDRWAAYAAGPSAWRRKDNQTTARLAEILSMDTLVPLESPGGKHLRSIAAQLLGELNGDIELIIRAMERLRISAKWRGIAPFAARAMICIEASKLRAMERKEKEWDAQRDAVDETAEPPAPHTCKLCGKEIFPEHAELDCKYH